MNAKFCGISSAEVAVVIDNARLYDLNARIHEDLERELRIAYDIQKSMLPRIIRWNRS